MPASQARLSKFWGLMCEADRPWQRRVIVHLAVELPPPACYRYQQLKPSSMQQVISERAQVRIKTTPSHNSLMQASHTHHTHHTTH